MIAGMEKQVYLIDLKSIAERHAGSSPATRSNICPGDVMVAMTVLEAVAERRGSSSLPWGTKF